MKRLYYKVMRDITAMRILASLAASPQRYEYIAEKIEKGELTNEEATQKNVNKALIMANQFVETIKANA